jgi:dephospho-CoA kinase
MLETARRAGDRLRSSQRNVVEPGNQRGKRSSPILGKYVLLEDRSLDRKKLSELCSDMEKRRSLRGLSIRGVFEEFIRLVKEVTSKDPNAIIQVDVS